MRTNSSVMILKICKGCGKEFEATHFNKKFCSPECYGTLKVCKECGKEFRNHFVNQPYCSRTCGQKHRITQVKKNCVICGKEYTVQARFDKKSKTCSKECKNQLQSIRLSGKQKSPRVTLTCINCGNEFTRLKSLFDRNPTDKPICSGKCKAENPRSRFTKICEACGKEFVTSNPTAKHCSNKCRRPRYEQACEVCGKIFIIPPNQLGRRRCCSYQCANIAHSKDLGGRRIIEYVKTKCANCGKEIEREPSKVNGREYVYCNADCLAEHRKIIGCGSNNPNWKNGSSFEPYCPKFTPEFRRRVRAFFGDVCFLCGVPAEEHYNRSGKHELLSVHHVHYDKGICCNGRPEILVPLCRKHNGECNSTRQWWIEYFEPILYGPPWNGKTYFTKEEYQEAIKNGLKIPDIPKYKGTNKSKI